MTKTLIILFLFSRCFGTNVKDESSETFERIKEVCPKYESNDPHFFVNIVEKFNKNSDSAAEGSFGKTLIFDYRMNGESTDKTIQVAVKKVRIPLYRFTYAISEEMLLERKRQNEIFQQAVLSELLISFQAARQPELMKTYSCYWSNVDYDSVDIFMVLEKLSSEAIDYAPGVKNIPGVSKSVISNWVKAGPVHKLNALLGLVRQVHLLHTEIGVTHNDIKPSNIMFTDLTARTAKLIDFGGASLIGESVTSYTPAFLDCDANQLHKGDVQNDIWALGLSFAEILTQSSPGEIAFDESIRFRYWCIPKKFDRQKQTRDAVQKELIETIPWASNFGSNSFANLFYQMTRIKRRDRIKTAECVIERLEALIAAFKLTSPSSKDVEKLFQNLCVAKKLVII